MAARTEEKHVQWWVPNILFYVEAYYVNQNRNPTKTNSVVSSWKSVRYNQNLDFWDDGLNNNQRI